MSNILNEKNQFHEKESSCKPREMKTCFLISEAPPIMGEAKVHVNSQNVKTY